MTIIDALNDEKAIRQMAELLLYGFRGTGTQAWSTIEECLEETREAFEDKKFNRIAVDENNKILAWAGGIETYDGNVFELHPLVVHTEYQGKGIGRKMLEDFEEEVRKRKGTVVFLGSDDENNRTSLGGIDLYPNPLEHVANIKNTGGHPFEFYQKCGYTIVGVLPDANGFGKPDIYMTKRISE